MFTIDIIVKYTPVPLSVQRKSAEDAEAIYQQIVESIRSGNPQILELTCEKIPEKKIAVVISEVSGVQISQKSGAAATGRPPGFVSVAQ
ncbi:MAG: hypothetical protein O4805_01630 [Trichodesmium sp. St16_bin2-tuft]|jgi:hypothetical protein|nr:hypothetical protein [Trichodesmium sp. MAG_R02]MDE5076269.1 hypothetical protein [Trichodesmium sp. St5_bin2_1]MDE5082217.1 hypothetical protein [Trichodesmium sp. St18_bin1]MDE5085912.1 hypothetical protein [Trichodesmium sp. St16_bin2-tuft]MDE5107446.1 hypothetical protein [Trichodesmium sp. St17_bin3_1_1]MDE5111559.1 hypothetical protein [Trichodesmium sp. St7_bin2_1]MDE5117735.1 hypothetical protein [Trichodesmium sp. St2_bin2_1]MDE5124624.1 hypothetical protein [Trichodesmium sp. St